MRRLLRADRGQTIGFVAIALTALVGMTAFVLDVGAWFRADRQLQVVADAAALAGAQALPHDPGKAIDLAEDYADHNGGPTAEKMQVEKDVVANDTISVVYSEEAPGFFSNVLGFGSVTVRAKAKARASSLGSARFVAPIVVNEKHPMLQCKPKPCFDTPTVLDYYNLKTAKGPDGAGSFGFVDLTGEGSGTSDLKKEIGQGWDQMMQLGNYSARTGNPFSAIETDLQGQIGKEMLFPIYRTLKSSGTKATFDIVGWVGFVITSLDLHGSNEKFYGYFTRVVWEGLPAEDSSGKPADFGATVVTLTD